MRLVVPRFVFHISVCQNPNLLVDNMSVCSKRRTLIMIFFGTKKCNKP